MIPIIILILLKTTPTTTLLSPLLQLQTTDIKTLILNDVFIDKTDLIDNYDFKIPSLFKPPNLKIILAPSGWGKSTNINMLEKFYEIEVNQQGELLPRHLTTNDKFFLGGKIRISGNEKKKLEPLKISSNLDFVKHLGKYPVITLRLKNTAGSTFDEIVEKIKSCVMETFKNHEYLLLSSKIPDKSKIQNYIGGQFNETDLHESLDYLSEKLYQHFGRYVIILIDDFDIPIINAHLKFGNGSVEFYRIMELITKMITFPVRDPFYHRHVLMELITGVFKATELYTGSGKIMSSIPVILYQNARYGFTLKQIRALLTKSSTTAVNPLQIADWYKGYFGNYTFYLNPRSIMQCIARNGTIDYYHRPGNNVIDEFIDTILLSDNMQYEMNFWISDKSRKYQRLMDYLHLRDCIFTEKFFKTRILFHAGYFFTSATHLGFNLSRPNNEIVHYLETKTLQWVATKFNLSVPQFCTFVGQLSAGKIEEFQETLREYFCNAVDYLRIMTNVASLFHDGFMIAVNHTLSLNNSITAEGKNYEIMVIVPKMDRGDIAVILKYATFHDETDLSSVVKKNLEEINKGYNSDKFKAKYPHVKTICKIAMAFYGENFTLEHDKT